MLDEVGGGANPDPEKQQQIVDAWSSSQPYQDLQAALQEETAEPVHYESKYATKWTTQFTQLRKRASWVYYRSREYVVVRGLVIIIFAGVFGTAYWDMVCALVSALTSAEPH